MIIIIKKGSTLKLSVTLSVVALALICMITQWELYPLAPYTMYSYPFYGVNYSQIEVNFLTCGDFKPVKTKDWELHPWDEARLTEHFKVLFKTGKIELVKVTLEEILKRHLFTDDYCGLRAVRYSWNKMNVGNFNNPKVEILAEVFQ